MYIAIDSLPLDDEGGSFEGICGAASVENQTQTFGINLLKTSEFSAGALIGDTVK